MKTTDEKRPAHSDPAPKKAVPRSVDQLTQKNVETILQLEEATKAKASGGERMADHITQFCGSMTFVWLHIAWFGIWIVVNVWFPQNRRFDPFPFSFLTLIVSLEAIILSTFILISQNRQSHLSERRSHLDLQVNLLSEQENTKMLELLEKIAKRVGVEMANDGEIKAMEEAMKPEHLVKQIDKTINGTEAVKK